VVESEVEAHLPVPQAIRLTRVERVLLIDDQHLIRLPLPRLDEMPEPFPQRRGGGVQVAALDVGCQHMLVRQRHARPAY
jgi:hypothetical protein